MVTYCKSQAQASAEQAEWLFTAVGRSLPNQYGNQCSAAMQSYVTTMFGRPWTETLGYGNAIAHIDNASSVYFEKVWNDPKDPDLLPRIGDIAVYRGAAPLWDGRYYGHTGAVVRFNAATQTLVQQDGAAEPTRLFPDGYRYSVKPAHEDTFGYVGDPRVGDIRGWLRLRWQKVVYTGADTRGYGATSTVDYQQTTPAPRPSLLHGIDYSNHQPDLDPARIDADFIGVLATDGRGFKSPTLDRQITAAQAETHRTMVYHYARVGQSDSGTQARHFLAAAAKRIRAGAVPVLDWEEDQWNHRADWAIDWIKQVEKATGRQVWVYQRVKAAADKSWGSFRRPMWLSWYGTTADIHGYATDFSGMPKVPGWNVVLWQYSDKGRLPGYPGHLDLNVAFGDPWDRTAGRGALTTQSTSTDPLEEIMGWYKNRAEFEKAMARLPWTYRNPQAGEHRDAYAVLRQVPEDVLDETVNRRGEGPQKGKPVNLATVMAFEQDNQVKDRAVMAQILAQQQLILNHLGITTDEDGA